MLVITSRKNNTPVTIIRVSYGYNKQQGTSQIVYKDHFRYSRTTHSTDICVGERVPIGHINYLAEIGLYNGAYGTIIDTVYKNNRSAGPHDREPDLLHNCVVVDFLYLILSKTKQPHSECGQTKKENSGVPPSKISFLTSLYNMFPSQCKLSYKNHTISRASVHLFQHGLQLSIKSKYPKPDTVNLINSST